MNTNACIFLYCGFFLIYIFFFFRYMPHFSFTNVLKRGRWAWMKTKGKNMTSLQHYWHHYSVESNCTYHRFGNFRNIFRATPRMPRSSYQMSRLSMIQSSWHIKLTTKAFIGEISRGDRVEKIFEHTKLLSWTHQNHNCVQQPWMKKAGTPQKRPTTKEWTTVRWARRVDRWHSQIPHPRRVTHCSASPTGVRGLGPSSGSPAQGSCTRKISPQSNGFEG